MFLAILAFLGPVWAADVEWMHLPKEATVYAKPNMDADVVHEAEAGEKIGVRKRGLEYSRIQYKSDGKWRMGYIMNEDLFAEASPVKALKPRGDWGLGGGGLYTRLQHAGKNFETEDQVKYETDAYESTSTSYFTVVQWMSEDFWRLFATYRTTDYKSRARTNVVGAQTRDVELQHQMFSVILQRMWTPFSSKIFYFGVGGEISSSLSAKLTLGGNNVPVEKQDLPTYAGLQGVVGGQFQMTSWLSAFVEIRMLAYLNQSPTVLGGEVAAALLYWH